MKHIFLDFDRTLFDTEAFYKLLETMSPAPIKDIVQQKPVDIAKLIYPDVRDFLIWCQKANHQCYLLTFGERTIQESKFLACGISEYFAQTFYVEQGRKVDFIKNALKSMVPRENIVFIDDTISHLEAFQQELPDSQVLRMCRLGAKGSNVLDNRFVVVRDFNEVKTQILRM